VFYYFVIRLRLWSFSLIRLFALLFPFSPFRLLTHSDVYLALMAFTRFNFPFYMKNFFFAHSAASPECLRTSGARHHIGFNGEFLKRKIRSENSVILLCLLLKY
jgi:hypothetical protein